MTTTKRATSRKSKPTAKAAPPKGRHERVMAMLTRPSGVTLAQMVKEFGIQPHTARAYLSVEPRKVGKKAVLDRGTGVYRLG